MRFRSSAPRLLVGAVILVIVIQTALTSRLFSGMTAEVEQSQFDLMQAIITFNLRSAEDRALARAEMLADLPHVQRAFKAGDRPGLLAELGPMFKSQREKYGVDQLQLQVPPATTFLRLQAPDSFGDDVSKTRPMVVAVNRDHVTRKGPAIGRTGPALYGVVPVSDEAGGFIGSLEVGMDIGAVLDNLKAAYDLELALLVDEDQLRTLAPGIDKAVLDDKNRVGRYLKVHATHWEPLQVLATSRDLTAVAEPRRYVRSALDVSYGVLLMPLSSAAGVHLGVIVVAKDFSASRAAAGRALVWQALLALFAVVVLAGVILVVVRGLLLQPLAVITRGFTALAGGDRDATIEPDANRGEELAELAALHARLRVEGGSPGADAAAGGKEPT